MHAVVPAPDGSYVLSAGADCRIRLWDLVAPHASRVLGDSCASDCKGETAIYSNQVRAEALDPGMHMPVEGVGSPRIKSDLMTPCRDCPHRCCAGQPAKYGTSWNGGSPVRGLARPQHHPALPSAWQEGCMVLLILEAPHQGLV